ncbi:MAG TPA: TonB-dependent receptor, partial [Planctomycetota bacterium]|nr:TonB-dependent receptor [Planctomycetota bacterium]
MAAPQAAQPQATQAQATQVQATQAQAAQPQAAEPHAGVVTLPAAAQGLPVETVGQVARTPARTYTLPYQIVVEAEGGGVPLGYAGGRTILDADALEDYPAQTMIEKLRAVPGVYTQFETGTDSKPNISIRGVDARRSSLVTVLVDGIPVEMAPYGIWDLDIFPVTSEQIDSVDVIRSGAGIRYGPSVAGGVINFQTKQIPDHGEAEVNVVFGSDHAWSLEESVGGTQAGLGVIVTTVQKQGDGFRENADYDVDDVNGKLSYALTDKDTISAGISHWKEDSGSPGGLTAAAFEADKDGSLRPDDHFEGEVTTYRAGFVHEFDGRSALEVIGWFHDSFRSIDFAQPNSPPFTEFKRNGVSADTSALEARYTDQFTAFGLRNDVYVSGRFEHEEVHQHFTTEPPGGGPATVVQDADFTTNAPSIYLEDTLHLTEDLAWTVGARQEFIRMQSHNNGTDVSLGKSHDVTLPATSLTWTVTPHSALYTSYTEGFRVPEFF